MPNIDNLRQENPKWNNLPTTAIRVPEVFKEAILKFAQTLDMYPLASTEDVATTFLQLERAYQGDAQPATQDFEVTFSQDLIKVLNILIAERHLNLNETLRRSIATEYFFWNERKAGTKVLLLKDNNGVKDVKEVTFR
jgi:hypothetical protein